MSKYTITLKNLLDNGYAIMDFDYPIFDESYRKVLNQKIVDRYYFREIGLETPAQFKHYLKMRMNEIMPYYNQLYKSENIMNREGFNPLYNLDTTETQKRKIDSQGSTNGDSRENTSGTGSTKETLQDTPQTRIGDSNYVSSITDNDAKSTSTSTSDMKQSTKGTTMEEYESKVLGSGGLRYPADIIMEWRKSFLNIDVQIIDELNDLFMGVY